MSDNKNNDDIELDFLDDETELNFLDIDEDSKYDIDLEDFDNDEESEDDSLDDEITYYDEDDNVDSVKKKLTKEQIINRVMIGMGAAIAGFTIFYGVAAYGIFHKVKNDGNNQVVAESETTTDAAQAGKFVSPYSDENIEEDVKNVINSAQLSPVKTNFAELDNNVQTVLDQTVDSSKTNYENVRNIYDYLMANYKYQAKSYVDDDAVYSTVSGVNYVATLDMKIIYRANKSLQNNQGSPDDFACAFTVLTRAYGLESYYIDGAIYNKDGDYESHGYAIVVIGGQKYIFDPAYDSILLSDSQVEEEVTTAAETEMTEKEAATEDVQDKIAKLKTKQNTSPKYFSFCKLFSQVSDVYTTDDVGSSMENFGNFEALGELTFEVTMTSDNGQSSYGKVSYKAGYSEEGNSTASEGDIAIPVNSTINLKGVVTGSNNNTWKLVVKTYDSKMNYIKETTIYNDTDSLSENTLSYSPSKGGYAKLIYMVTDANGRTCTVSKTVRVTGDDYVVEEETERQTTTKKYVEEKQTTEVYTKKQQPTTTKEVVTEATTTEKVTEPATTVEEQKPVEENPTEAEEKPPVQEETTAQ